MSDEERVRELEAQIRWLYSSLLARAEEAKEVEEAYSALAGSAVVRVTAPLRAYFERHPRQYRLVRRVVRFGWRALTLRPLRPRAVAGVGFDPDAGYDTWIKRYDRLGGGEAVAIAQYAATLKRAPTISVLMPVCDPPVAFLRAAIDSVRLQAYEHWELCIADDASADPTVREVLKASAAEEPRIKLALRRERGGISAASNEAAGLATGDYVGFLDHDDVLRPHALLLVADELSRHPEALLVYSDEDKLDEHETRSEHHFKPDWNPALLLSQNYVAHLAVIDRARFAEVGGFRSEYDGSQDWDLYLRVTDGVHARQIRHVPHVLYHWRRSPDSTAQRGEAKAYSVDAARRAVADALRRRDVAGTVTTIHGAYQRVRYAVPEPCPRVDVVMPSACNLEFLKPCLEGLLHQTAYEEIAVTLVVSSIRLDNDTQRAFLRDAERDPRVHVLVYDDRPYNYSWLNNYAIAGLDGQFVLLMNDDLLVIHDDWLEALVGHVLQPGVGAVGAKLIYPSERIQHAGVILGGGGIADHYHRPLPREHPGYHARAWLDQDFSCVTAGCMLLRREAFDQAGGFDEELAVAFNDVDLCMRMADAGWRIVWTPSAELYHCESVSVGKHNSPERQEEFSREERMMASRWGPRLLSDPYYNPNLSLRHLNTLSFPPRVEYPWRAAVEHSE